jgi:hypothetical protein
MQHSKILFLVSIFLFASLIISCEVNSDDGKECEQTKWDKVEEPTISLRVTQPDNHCEGNTHKADTADNIKVTGSIQKYYCDDTPSGRFDFTKIFQPGPGIDYVHVGQQYRFKFENDKDRLVFRCTLKAYFIDGNIYETIETDRTFYYNDIKFDANALEYYILFSLPDLSWHVSS